MFHELTPKCLDDIAGQPATRHLKVLVTQPYASCWLLEGAPGIGKTVTAHAVAAELGCRDEFTGKQHIPCSELGIDAAKELFSRTLRLRYGSESGFNILILEELEWISPQCQRYMKDALDPMTRLPRNLVVIATSNGAQNLDEALLERFRLLAFSNGPSFQEACLERLAAAWEQETGEPCLPLLADTWGIKRGRFSMRTAIRDFEFALSGAARGFKVVA